MFLKWGAEERGRVFDTSFLCRSHGATEPLSAMELGILDVFAVDVVDPSPGTVFRATPLAVASAAVPRVLDPPVAPRDRPREIDRKWGNETKGLSNTSSGKF